MKQLYCLTIFSLLPGTVYSQMNKPVGPAGKMDWWMLESDQELYLALLMTGLFLGVLFLLWQGFDGNNYKYRTLYFAGALISILLMIAMGINAI